MLLFIFFKLFFSSTDYFFVLPVMALLVQTLTTMKKRLLLAFTLAGLQAYLPNAHAQYLAGKQSINPAAAFLRLAPDARSAGMGEAGVASSLDANSLHYNAAKLAFVKQKVGASLSYTPWLIKLVKGQFLTNASGYYRLDDKQALGLAFSYFKYGEFMGGSSAEYALGGSYARKLSDHFSISLGVKYIYSSLRIFSPSGIRNENGQTLAADLGIYYTNEGNLLGKRVAFAFGGSLTNLAGSLSYRDKDARQYIPATLKFGPAIGYRFNDDHHLSLTVDINKLLVPTWQATVPIGQSSLQGSLISFSDAPGGLKEELQEVYLASGAEYIFKKQWFVRAGYFSTHKQKDNVKYFTVGTGLRYKVASVDFAYLIPQVRHSPLGETMRFTLRFDLDEKP